MTLLRKNAQQTFFPFAGVLGIKTVQYSYRFAKTQPKTHKTNSDKSEDTGNTYIHTRLIETRRDTKRHKYTQTQKY